MMRKVPIVATAVVLLAVATMIALGLWQLGRADEKDALLQRYASAGSEAAPVAWPDEVQDSEQLLYRRSALECSTVTRLEQVAGTAASGEKGWAHRASCTLPGGAAAIADLGWSRAPGPFEWSGGTVTGAIAPGPRLVADPPVAGLEALAKPDPRDLPNNHLSYAVQWFLFALTALVIYVFALRRRWRERS